MKEDQTFSDDALGLHDKYPRGYGIYAKGNICCSVINIQPFLQMLLTPEVWHLSRDDTTLVNRLLPREGEQITARRAPREGDRDGPTLRLAFNAAHAQNPEELAAALPDVRLVDAETAARYACLLYTSPSPRDRG